MDLFSLQDAEKKSGFAPGADWSTMPLAARMRPRTLAEVAGQKHLLAEGKLLRRAIETDRFTSLIFYGPPGCGKTTLASVIAHTTNAHFMMLNGVESNVAEIRERIAEAQMRMSMHRKRTVLFVDELHRFNKAQQDVLLPHLEKGTVRFIGATTENPYFAINSPLLSRSQVFPLEPVAQEELVELLQRACFDTERGFGSLSLQISDEAVQHLAARADGDARKALTALEVAVLSTPASEDGTVHVDLQVAEESIQKKAIRYDRLGDAHYDTISAFIKSMRGSDPDAALYWLAMMLEAGEDIRFIARRIVIAASEDVGLADSNALRVAMDAARAAEMLGMPEARIPLAHATVYLATAPKSNSAYMGINAALEDVRNGKTLAVPEHLRTPTRKKLAQAGGVTADKLEYLYAHDYEEHFVPQAYLPEGRVYYTPTTNGLELRIKERMEHRRRLADEKKDIPRNSAE
ncbi:MAG: replication-associated recombination protein A [Akkermansia sp.]|nr:replication-associated recombination protein A [Akkermansia sp.]